MLVVTIVATVVAAIGGWAAWRSASHAKATVDEAKRSADAAEASLAEARRSADAAERAAGAATVTADVDRAADHRAREPKLAVTVDKKVEYNGTEGIYRVLNDGPVDLDSVVVHRPVVGEVEGRIVHHVAHTGETGYEDQAPLGAIAVTEYERFTLSLGVRDQLPEFRVRIVCRAGDEEWTLIRILENPRKPKPPPPPQAARQRSVRLRDGRRRQLGGF